MVTDALRGNRIIGLVMLQPGFEANYEGRPPINAIGCAGVITETEPLPDGRIGIVLTGLVKFRVNSEDNSRSYRLAQVTAIPEVPNDEERAALRKLRQRLEAMLADPRPGAEPRFPPSAADDALINALAQRMNIEPSDRQALLERQGALSRGQGLIDLLEKLSGAR